jgi:ClpP class serine protease
MADVFIGAIARNRDVAGEIVQTHYGGGDVMIGARAVEAGLADRVGSLEQLIQELSTSPQSPPLEGFFVANPPPPKQEKTPMDLETLTKEHPALSARSGRKAQRQNAAGSKRLSVARSQGTPEARAEIALHTDISAVEAQHFWPAPRQKSPQPDRRLIGSWPAFPTPPSHPQAMMRGLMPTRWQPASPLLPNPHTPKGEPP